MQPDMTKLLSKAQTYLKEEPCPKMKAQISHLLIEPIKNVQQLHERFNTAIGFGTAGVRGLMQAGYAHINQFTCFHLALALTKWLKQTNTNTPKMVIGYDGRNNSYVFAKEIAQVFLNQHFQVSIFDEPIATPICAFSAKYFEAHLAIMVTASHNPKDYNGIKIFHQSSMQISQLEAKKIEQFIDFNVSRVNFVTLYPPKRTLPIAQKDEVFSAYFSSLSQHSFRSLMKDTTDVPVVYTALHGVGEKFFKKALSLNGFNNVHCVKEQSSPDGNFPTVTFPNPEEKDTLDLAKSYAKKMKIKYVLANDPDADRLAVGFFSEDNKTFHQLTGNEMGAILGYFAILASVKNPQKPLVATSIVSSRMLQKMAKMMDAYYLDTLTGFGNIVGSAQNFVEQTPSSRLVFAYEEAIGFLFEGGVMDKDGILAGLRFMETLCILEDQRKSPYDFLLELYERFGLFISRQWTITFLPNQTAKISSLMNSLRNLNIEAIETVLNTKNLKKNDLLTNNATSCHNLPSSNVLIFENDTTRFIARPSGTEPKIKFYLELIKTNLDRPVQSAKQEMEIKCLKINNQWNTFIKDM